MKWEPKAKRETLSAIAAAVLAALLIAGLLFLLAGCAGGQVYGKYSHRSSIPTYNDWNTSDTFGGCVQVNLCSEERCGRYSPIMAGCVNWEITDRLVYGRDPSGEIEIRQPVKSW